MATGSPALYADFSGGLNLEAGPYLVQDNECQDVRNFTANKQGALSKRRGFEEYSDLTSTNASGTQIIDSVHSLFPVTLATKSMLAVGKTTSASTDSIVKISSSGVTTALKTGLSQGKRWDFVQATQSLTNEKQTITLVHATGGTFTVTYSGQTTSAIAHDADANAVATALIALSNIGPNDVSVTKSGTVYTVTFTGALAGTNVETMTANGSSLSGSGSSATVATIITGRTEGPIYGMNGTNTPQFWDGTSASTSDWTANIGTVPTGTKLLLYHMDRLWASGDPNYPGRIWATGISDEAIPVPDPCNWDTDYIDNVEPSDGQNITALGKIGPYLLVFKERKTYVLSDPFSGQYRTISSTVGCDAPRSVVETTNGTIFLSEDLGVCITDGSQIRPLSDKIKPLLQEIANAYPGFLSKSAATYHEDSYYLSIPFDGPSNQITLEYQMGSNAWWIHTCNSNQFIVMDSAGASKVYSANAQRNSVDEAFVEDVYTDFGNAYKSYWTGPFWVWGQPHINKRLGQWRVDGRGLWQLEAATSFSDLSAEYEVLDSTDWEEPSSTASDTFGGSGNFGGTGTFGPQLGVVQRRYYTPAKGWGRAWSLRVSDPGNANQAEMFSITAFTRPRAD